jgi:hypothetical protein
VLKNIAWGRTVTELRVQVLDAFYNLSMVHGRTNRRKKQRREEYEEVTVVV